MAYRCCVWFVRFYLSSLFSLAIPLLGIHTVETRSERDSAPPFSLGRLLMILWFFVSAYCLFIEMWFIFVCWYFSQNIAQLTSFRDFFLVCRFLRIFYTTMLFWNRDSFIYLMCLVFSFLFFLPFLLSFLSFVSLQQLELSRTMLNENGEISLPWVFHRWVYYLQVFCRCVLTSWRSFPSIPSLLRFLKIIPECLILSNALWSYEFLLHPVDMVDYTDFKMLNQFCMPGINPTWSKDINIFIHCRISFANILLRIFASNFMRDIGL